MPSVNVCFIPNNGHQVSASFKIIEYGSSIESVSDIFEPRLRGQNSEMKNQHQRLSLKISQSSATCAQIYALETATRLAKLQMYQTFLVELGHAPRRRNWLAGAGGFEPPNGGIKICPTSLTWHAFSPNCGEKRPCRINTLAVISQL